MAGIRDKLIIDLIDELEAESDPRGPLPELN
jgi:hypothetical protein